MLLNAVKIGLLNMGVYGDLFSPKWPLEELQLLSKFATWSSLTYSYIFIGNFPGMCLQLQSSDNEGHSELLIVSHV